MSRRKHFYKRWPQRLILVVARAGKLICNRLRKMFFAESMLNRSVYLKYECFLGWMIMKNIDVFQNEIISFMNILQKQPFAGFARLLCSF